MQPTPWADLTARARAMADLADELATRAPADLAPDENGDPLKRLDAMALELVGLASDCRRATWQELKDEGITGAGIARLWKTSAPNVSQILSGKKRAR